MIDALVASAVISWFVILGLGVMVYALSRQIGVLHERLKPVGALSIGQALNVGDKAPEFSLASLNGGMTQVGGESSQTTLLFFLSPDCPVCKTLLPVIRSISAQERDWLRVVFASDGNDDRHEQMIVQHQLQSFPYLLSAQLGMAYQVSKLPYAYLIGPDGSVLAHGLTNNREHLESLFNAATQKEGSYVQQMAG